MARGFIALFIFVVGLIVLGLLVWPKFQEFRNFSKQVQNIQTTLEQREQYFSQLSQVLKNLERDTQTLQKFDQALPNKPDPDRLIYFLASATKNSGMILTEIENLSAAPLQGSLSSQQSKVNNQFQLKEIKFSAKLSGTYPSFKNLLKEIESSGRLFEIERVSILPSFTSENLFTSPQTTQTLKFEIEIKAYSY